MKKIIILFYLVITYDAQASGEKAGSWNQKIYICKDMPVSGEKADCHHVMNPVSLHDNQDPDYLLALSLQESFDKELVNEQSEKKGVFNGISHLARRHERRQLPVATALPIENSDEHYQKNGALIDNNLDCDFILKCFIERDASSDFKNYSDEVQDVITAKKSIEGLYPDNKEAQLIATLVMVCEQSKKIKFLQESLNVALQKNDQLTQENSELQDHIEQKALELFEIYKDLV